MSRANVKYLLLFVLVVTLFFWKTLLTDQFTIIIGSEGVNLTYGWLHFLVKSVWQGHIPLWDPYAFAGNPFVASMQPAVFYPLQLLFALVPFNKNAMISPRFYHEYLALAHLLCAFFMFALLRELRRSRFAAFVGACAFSLGGLLVRMIWPLYIESCIWLPLVILFLFRAFRTERRDRALMEAVFGGVALAVSILSGGMAFFFMQAIVVLTAGAYYAISGPSTEGAERRTHWIRAAAILAVLLAVAGGLGAIQLLPANEYGKFTSRFIDGGIFPSAKKIPYDRLVPGVWPQSIVSALFPAGFDGKIGGEEYFPFYIGVLPFFLAVAAVWRYRKRLWVRYFAGLAVLCFAYALGEFSPLNGVLYAVVPYLWLTRGANRFFYLISFALAILAAFGLDALFEAESRGEAWLPARRILKWIAIACAAALFVPGLFPQMQLSLWNAFSLLLILCASGLFAYLTRNSAGAGVRVWVAAFILFDLAAFNWIEVNKNVLRKSGDQFDQMVSLRGAAEFVRGQQGLHRVRVGVQPEPNVGDVYGVQSVWGGGAAVLTNYSDLGLHDDLLNVRYNIKPASATDPGSIYHDAKWKVYENPAAFPRAWVVHRTVLAPSHEASFALLDRPGVDLHETAIVEKQLTLSTAGGANAKDTVRFRSYEPEAMTLDVTAGNAGLLVLSEMYYPGWRATVDGRPAEIRLVDGALRGIEVPRGASRVALEFISTSFRAGAAVSLLTVLCVVAGWIYTRRGEHAVNAQRTSKASTSI